jgi:hypothetical protein
VDPCYEAGRTDGVDEPVIGWKKRDMDDRKVDPDKENDEAPTAGKESAVSSDSKADDAGVSDADVLEAAQPSSDGESPPSEPKATASEDSAESSENSTSQDDAESKDAGKSGSAEPEDDAKKDEKIGDESKKDEKDDPETWTNTIVWVFGIVLVLSIELFIYGHNGFLRVCVGVDTLTDYSLKAEPRTRENAKSHPFCAERLNLGMWTSSEELSKESLADACNGAARVVGQEHKQPCLRKDKPWTREVEMEQVMPWDPRLYRRLLFLE